MALLGAVVVRVDLRRSSLTLMTVLTWFLRLPRPSWRLRTDAAEVHEFVTGG